MLRLGLDIVLSKRVARRMRWWRGGRLRQTVER
jgi:hypothetical protein